MRSLSLLALLLTGCSFWVPDDYPVALDVGGLNEHQALALKDAVDAIEDAAHFDVFEPLETNGKAIQRGRVAVRSNGKSIAQLQAKKHDLGNAHINHWSCKIELPTDAPHELVTHELMHCLGLAHDDVPGSIMGEIAGWDIRREHVEHIRALAGLEPDVRHQWPR
jgi:hypothetical protein